MAPPPCIIAPLCHALLHFLSLHYCLRAVLELILIVHTVVSLACFIGRFLEGKMGRSPEISAAKTARSHYTESGNIHSF